MTQQALIQSQIYNGFGIAASVLGAPCVQSRSPNGTSRPVGAGTTVATVNAIFRNPSGPFVSPAGYGKMMFYGTFNPTGFLHGDYLTDPTGVAYFVASVEAMNYPLMIRCNGTMSFWRPAGTTPALITPPTVPGNYLPPTDLYGGDQTSTEVPLITGWPVSVLQGTKGEKGEVALPGDVRVPWVYIMVPDLGVVQFQPGDQAVDTQPIPMRYTVSGVERSSLGWRISAMMETA